MPVYPLSVIGSPDAHVWCSLRAKGDKGMIDRANVLLLELVAAASNGKDRLRREEGQTFVEYALVILLIAVAVGAVATWSPLQTAITTAITKIKDTINA